MEKQQDLDLSELLTDSLSLHSISNPQTRMIIPKKENHFKRYFRQDPMDILGEKSFGEPRKISREVIGTPIQEFFRDANVFITGGTGFIGKLLTEKLVRSMPHIGHIYILIRPKRGKNVQERFERLMEDRVFLRMKTEVPHYRAIISGVEGDIVEPGLGLSDSDRQLLLEKVNVVFHSAADVRFVEPLRAAIRSNVYGSKNVLKLAKDMKHIKSYVHVSTAYSQCVRRVIPESIPKMSLDYRKILEEIESMTDEELEMDLTRLLQGWPNTYTFTKALSEEMVQSEADGLPVIIFRPSVVVPTYREPVRGYTDNLYGPIGMMLGLFTGVVRCFPVPDHVVLDMVPVDYVVNCMIAVARHGVSPQQAITRADGLLPVYNYTCSPHFTGMTWKSLVGLIYKMDDKWPLSRALWTSHLTMTESLLFDRTAHLFLHEIPGMFLDKISVMLGQKPLLTKTYNTLQKLKEPLSTMATKMLEFETDNVVQLRDSLTEGERKLFNFDIRDVDIKEWLFNGKLGLRYYYMKEKMDTLEAAGVKNRRLRILNRTVKVVFGLAILKMCVIVSHILPI